MLESFIAKLKDYKTSYPIAFGYIFFVGIAFNLGFSSRLNNDFFVLLDLYDHIKSALLAIPFIFMVLLSGVVLLFVLWLIDRIKMILERKPNNWPGENIDFNE